MKYWAGGCAHSWCRALLLSPKEPGNTVFGLIYCDWSLYYTIYKTYHPYTYGWWYIYPVLQQPKRSFLKIFSGKEKQWLGFDHFTFTADFLWRVWGWFEGGWKDRGQSRQISPLGWNVSIEHNPIPTVICESIGAPFIKRHHFNGEECKIERLEWVGWHGGEQRGNKKRKKRFFCVSLMVFSESKWATDEKREWCADTVWERENQIWRIYAPGAKQCPWGGRRDEQQSECADVGLVVTVSVCAHISSCSTYKKGHSSQSMKLC